MQVFSPYVAFESWLSRGLILEVIMQERMLAAHVRSVLNHLKLGYSRSHGTFRQAIDNNLNLLRMRLMAPISIAYQQAAYFDRYS